MVVFFYLLVQKQEAICVGLLIMVITTAGTTLQPAQAAFIGLTFEELSRQAKLIILGEVLDEKLTAPGSNT